MEVEKSSPQELSTRTLCEVNCALCPDVVEWCNDPKWRGLLAHGTYQYDDARGTREGTLQLSRVRIAENENRDDEVVLEPLCVVPIAGVYDIAWSPKDVGVSNIACDDGPGSLMAVAAADGALRVSAASCAANGQWQCIDVIKPYTLLDDAILTHVAWGAAGPRGIAAVGQDGSAHQLELRPEGIVNLVATRQAHDLETWCVEVSASLPTVVLTGADDGEMRGWDLREPPDSAPCLVNRRSHGAGVTALASAGTGKGVGGDPNIIATGSYDERVRLFDLRSCRSPLVETEALGDGAYHLSWHPLWDGVLAVAAMRSGLPILRASAGATDLELTELSRYAADAPEGSHGSLAYGVCWQQAPEDPNSAVEGDWLAASVSFYDRTLHVWKASLR